MSEQDVFQFLFKSGCCEGCCLRFLGLRNPDVYKDIKIGAKKFTQTEPFLKPTESEPKADCSVTDKDATPSQPAAIDTRTDKVEVPKATATGSEDADVANGDSRVTEEEQPDGAPPAKRKKWAVCVCCLGLLQEETWSECIVKVKENLEKKGYQCDTFACALSAPVCTLLREKALSLLLEEEYPGFGLRRALTPLKEAWKWSFGERLEAGVGKTLDSGAISPLLVTLNMEYPDDLEELECLKRLSPAHFEARDRQRRRFTVDFTRRSVELALESSKASELRAHYALPPPAPAAPARCESAHCVHAPLHLAGRYVKLSRTLPQSPWILNGVRMLPSSVQEIIYQPIARFYKIGPSDVEHRLKFLSAGREDVDVRCLGTGRPFALEVSDPTLIPSSEELKRLAEEISTSHDVKVADLQVICREDLAYLKKGEESKCKTYEALCVKLTHSKSDLEGSEMNGDTPVVVTDEDIASINRFTNVAVASDHRVLLKQKTPLRVLHRRPLLTRDRKILDLDAVKIEGRGALFLLRARTEAGTYVKEWVHGDLGRTRPALREALGARADILALDVTAVELDWPLQPRP